MELKTYEGCCHCGAVRYRVRTALDAPFDCNCSRCKRVAAVMQSVPAGDFSLVTGEDALVLYRFNHHAIDHYFCRACGIAPFSRGTAGDTPMVVVNVGCLEGVPPVDRSRVLHYDGAEA